MKTRIFRTSMRDADFIENCRVISRKNPTMEIPQVVLAALNRSPKCYYLDFDRTSAAMHYMLEHNGSNPYVRENRRDEADEVFARTCATAKRMNLPFDRALARVLNYRRPTRFFISYDRAVKLVRDLVRREYSIV